jgi:hypothetical protein
MLLAVSKNKICVKETKLSWHGRPPPQKKSDEGMDAIPQQEFQKCFKQWQLRRGMCIATQGEYLSVNFKYIYTGTLAIKSFLELRTQIKQQQVVAIHGPG